MYFYFIYIYRLWNVWLGFFPTSEVRSHAEQNFLVFFSLIILLTDVFFFLMLFRQQHRWQLTNFEIITSEVMKVRFFYYQHQCCLWNHLCYKPKFVWKKEIWWLKTKQSFFRKVNEGPVIDPTGTIYCRIIQKILQKQLKCTNPLKLYVMNELLCCNSFIHVNMRIKRSVYVNMRHS